MTKKITFLTLSALICFSLYQCTNESMKEQPKARCSISDSDQAAIIQTRKAFEAAWLANDSVGILNTLTSDAVLMPHHGDQPISGIPAIEAFWFPKDYPPSQVTEFTSTITEVVGSKDIAYIYGRFKLSFDYEGKTYSNEGNYMNTFRKEENNWKLARLIWNDPVPTIE